MATRAVSRSPPPVTTLAAMAPAYDGGDEAALGLLGEPVELLLLGKLVEVPVGAVAEAG